jgi:hypothetical protein
MATITTPPPQPWNRDDSQRRVTHPLHRLRSSIRTYVSAEGLATLGLYLVLWFWIGLLVDYGFFKAFGVDWVQALPWQVRAIILAGLVAGLLALVVTRMLLRLFREFRDTSLALVLERRFPAQLGDRLITAVELADPRLAARYGYSQAMIDQTLRDAAERVDRLPVHDVFDWPRLRRAFVWLAALSLGVYLLVGVAYCAFTRSGGEVFVLRFNNVAGIWFERNILLANIIWPRRAYLELVNFPDSGDLRVGRNAPPPTLHVRALKWVVADVTAPEGWRPLKWADLTPSLLGKQMNTGAVPQAWHDWTVDQVELQLEKPESAASLDANTLLALRDVLAQLEARVDSPRTARWFRKLMIPDVVTVYYRGDTIRSEQTLKKQGDNEYSGVLSDLKESVRFTVNGEDYYTPAKTITVVPPPSLVELTCDEEQPAYLYHRPPQGGRPSDLRGKKQIFSDTPISLSGSASRADVPAGTNLLLRGRTDKQLRLPDGVRLRPQERGPAIHVPVHQAEDGQSFEVRFNNLSAPLDFEFEFIDTDNVIGRRHVILKPLEDAPPDVDTLVEVIRKTRDGYLITPNARIPFSGKIRDDHGLNDVSYDYTLAALETQNLAATQPVVSAFQFTPRVFVPNLLLVPSYLGWVGQAVRNTASDANQRAQTVPLDTFIRRQREDPMPELTPDLLEKRLHEKPEGNLFRNLDLDPEEESFDVEKLHLKSSDDKKPQPHYRMRLWIVATDNNVETGPGIGESKEKLTFLIVSENELLLEIAKEEESLHVKLEDAVNRLKDGRNKLEQVSQELAGLQEQEFSPMARRLEEILETQTKSWDVSREVYIDYRKILKELQVNRVHPKIIEKVERNICEPLDGAINQEFVRSDEALHTFLKALEEKKKDAQAANDAKEKLDQLIDKLTRILDAMGDLTTINKLIEQLVYIHKTQTKMTEEFKQLRDHLQDDLLNSALPGGKDK